MNRSRRRWSADSSGLNEPNTRLRFGPPADHARVTNNFIIWYCIRWGPGSLQKAQFFFGGGACSGHGHCEIQGLFGVRRSYSVGGSSDAAFRCQYCNGNLLILTATIAVQVWNDASRVGRQPSVRTPVSERTGAVDRQARVAFSTVTVVAALGVPPPAFTR